MKVQLYFKTSVFKHKYVFHSDNFVIKGYKIFICIYKISIKFIFTKTLVNS